MGGCGPVDLMVAKGLFYGTLILWGTGVTGTNRNRTDIAWTILAVSGMGVSVCVPSVGYVDNRGTARGGLGTEGRERRWGLLHTVLTPLHTCTL